MRRLPHQGARHSTVYHGDASDGVFLLLRGCRGKASMSSSTCGCFLRVEWSSSRMISLLFFRSSFWMASRANGSLHANGGASTYLGLHRLQVQEREANCLRNGPGRPALFTHPFALVGPLDILHFAPSNCINLTMSSSCPRWRVFSNEVLSFTLQSSGISYATLWSLPPLGVISSCTWTRTRLLICSFELVVTPSFLSMFSYKNITLPNAHTKMNISLVCLVAG
jgi:hypothetical protein